MNKRLEPNLMRMRDWQEVSEYRVVVVGAGPVGVRVAELLDATGRRSVLLIGNEAAAPYDRAQLSTVLAGQTDLEDIEVEDSVTGLGATRLINAHIVQIDREKKCVVDRLGLRYAYDDLVLALGSKPAIPPVPGVHLAGVFTFRSLSDVSKLIARRARSRHTVILGGGLLGVEAARGMLRSHTKVTLIEHNTHLLFNQLDAQAAQLLRAELENEGIEVRTRSRLRMAFGGTHVEGVVLGDRTELPCDTLIFATGIQPNVDLAREAGLAVGRGITVDGRMRTADTNIFAVGECSEFEGRTYGVVAPGYEQAAIAVNELLDSSAGYKHPVLATSLKVVNLSVAAIGDANEGDPSARPITFTRAGQYRRLNLRNNRVTGALAIGDWPDLVMLKEVIASKSRLSWWRRLRFRLDGELWRADERLPSRLPDSAVICNCNAVTKGVVCNAVAAGADNVAAITVSTGAGAICGTCKPSLAQLAGGSATTPAVRFAPAALIICAVALMMTAGAIIAPNLPYADSATYPWHWDVLWTTSEYKQTSGFTLLGLGVLGTFLALRKRISGLRSFGNFDAWRLFHLIVGTLCLVGLLVHTGFRFGSNLNFYLMSLFTALSFAGIALGSVIALEHRLAPAAVARVRRLGFLIHLGLCWPLPALLAFHVFKTYYF